LEIGQLIRLPKAKCHWKSLPAGTRVAIRIGPGQKASKATAFK
jgi:hypothetical protein